MKKSILCTLTMTLLMGLMGLTGCKSQSNSPESAAKNDVAGDLVKEYQNGEVKSCQYEGKLTYECSTNAYDGGVEIYDAEGTKIGSCYYNTGMVDPMCGKLTDCDVIYRVANNVWGKPEVTYSK